MIKFYLTTIFNHAKLNELYEMQIAIHIYYTHKQDGNLTVYVIFSLSCDNETGNRGIQPLSADLESAVLSDERIPYGSTNRSCTYAGGVKVRCSTAKLSRNNTNIRNLYIGDYNRY